MARHSRAASLETRERLLDAALEVFAVRGVSCPSLSDVAALAGVTRGAVYVHFENKADLFAALCDRSIRTLDVAEALPADATPLARLRAGLVYTMRETAVDPARRRIMDVLFHKCEMHEHNREILERARGMRRRSLGHLQSLGHAAVAAGELPADLDVDRAVAFVYDCAWGVIKSWLLDPEGSDLAADAAGNADALVDMLRTARALRRR